MPFGPPLKLGHDNAIIAATVNAPLIDVELCFVTLRFRHGGGSIPILSTPKKLSGRSQYSKCRKENLATAFKAAALRVLVQPSPQRHRGPQIGYIVTENLADSSQFSILRAQADTPKVDHRLQDCEAVQPQKTGITDPITGVMGWNWLPDVEQADVVGVIVAALMILGLLYVVNEVLLP